MSAVRREVERAHEGAVPTAAAFGLEPPYERRPERRPERRCLVAAPGRRHHRPLGLQRMAARWRAWRDAQLKDAYGAIMPAACNKHRARPCGTEGDGLEGTVARDGAALGAWRPERDAGRRRWLIGRARLGGIEWRTGDGDQGETACGH